MVGDVPMIIAPTYCPNLLIEDFRFPSSHMFIKNIIALDVKDVKDVKDVRNAKDAKNVKDVKDAKNVKDEWF